MNFLTICIQWYKKLSFQHRTALLCIILMSVGVLFFLSWGNYSHRGVLFNQLSPEDASQIRQQLDSAHLPYEIQNQGQTILMDKTLIEKTRLQLMGPQLHLAGPVGFELFNKSDFGLTDFSQKINYQRALQGELERSISTLDEIQHVRVHLVIPERGLFKMHTDEPRAAIKLHLKCTLNASQLLSIKHLVAASVAHLSLKNIVIVDQHGHYFNQNSSEATASSPFKLKKTLENYLCEKAMQLLQGVFPNDAVLVKVDVSLNYDDFRRERIRPESNGSITHFKEIEQASGSSLEKPSKQKTITREKTYQLGSRKENIQRQAGRIKRLTISALVPESTSKQVLMQLEHLLRAAVGIDEKRGDLIRVEALLKETFDSTLPMIPILSPKSSALPHVHSIGLIVLFGLSGGMVYWQKLRRKRRQHLLNDLTQWLGEQGV